MIKKRIRSQLKFIYSEKATKYCKISTVDLTVTIQDKSTVKISQHFVAFSEYMNFKAVIEIIFSVDNSIGNLMKMEKNIQPFLF